MNNDKHARQGAVGGIVFAILTIVGFAIVIPKPPDVDSSAATFAAYYVDHQNAIRAGLTIVGVGIFFYLWFLGSLRSALAAAEGGAGRLTSIAYGAGLIVAAFFVVGLAAGETAAFRPDDVDPGVTRAFNDFFVVIGAPAATAFTAFFAATALIGFRHAALPRWAAGLSALAAIGALPGIGTSLTTTGPFAGDGVLGLFVPVFTFVIGLVAISVALMRGPVASGPEPSRAST
jgi:hypothetical protein